MEATKLTKRGRKPLPNEQKKKSIWAVFPPEIVRQLEKDVEEGESDTINQRITQIVISHYSNIHTF